MNDVLGSEHLQTYQACVDALMGTNKVPVFSTGSDFYHVNTWTLRKVVQELCKAKGVPTEKDIEAAVRAANAFKVDPYIVIGATPERMTRDEALALTGGAYHEGLHGLLTCRRKLEVEEILNLITQEMRDEIKPELLSILLLLDNLVEDIRIERNGSTKYPMIKSRLEALADWIVARERTNNRAQAAFTDGLAGPAKDSKDSNKEMWALIVLIRDLGKGFETPEVLLRIEEIKEQYPDVAKLVEGPLEPLIKEMQGLSYDDDTGSLRLAFRLLHDLTKLGRKPEDFKVGGDGITVCPVCGHDTLTLDIDNPLSTKGILSCPKCGWSKEVDVQHSKGSGGKGGKLIVRIKNAPTGTIGETSEDGSEGEGGEGEKGKGKGEKGLGKGGSKGGGNGGKLGGGRATEAPKNLLDRLLEGIEGAKAQYKEIGDLLKEQNQRSAGREPVLPGEAPYKVASTARDKIGEAPSSHSKDVEQKKATQLEASLKAEMAFLRSRFQTLLRGFVNRALHEGLPRGPMLSGRFLVDTVASLRAGVRPQRAFARKGDKIDVTVAAAVVLDQSGSMSDQLEENTKICMTIAEPLSSLGGKVMVCGFRDNWSSRAHMPSVPLDDRGARTDGIAIDIFKDYSEGYHATKHRFVRTTATGGTPMADGIEYGLRTLRKMAETHRIIFVVTDGYPNGGHGPIIQRQIRQAKEEGILVIGVGCGPDAKGVMSMFPESVWAQDVKNIPALLMERLGQWIVRTC